MLKLMRRLLSVLLFLFFVWQVQFNVDQFLAGHIGFSSKDEATEVMPSPAVTVCGTVFADKPALLKSGLINYAVHNMFINESKYNYRN